MSEETKDNNDSAQPRDDKGRFAPKNETAINGQTPVTELELPFINAFMAKQLGLSDKFADLQQQFTPEALYHHLKFTAMTKPSEQAQSSKLPPNEQVAPISPSPGPLDNMPGTIIGKPNLTDENFSIQLSMDPRELLSPKKKK